MREDALSVEGKERRDIELALKVLFAIAGDPRHRYLTEQIRTELKRIVIEYLSGEPERNQVELHREWMKRIILIDRNLDLGQRMLESAKKLIYPDPKMVQWAESRLLNKNMQITPSRLAVEYALLTKKSKAMAGEYVRDMQRIKATVTKRLKQGTGGRRGKYEVSTPRPRLKRTARQERKYQENCRREEGT